METGRGRREYGDWEEEGAWGLGGGSMGTRRREHGDWEGEDGAWGLGGGSMGTRREHGD